MWWFPLPLTTFSYVTCGELHNIYFSYNTSSIQLIWAGFCTSTEKLREKIKHDISVFLNNSVLPNIFATCGACDCGGPGWRRATYLNMSDPTWTCPPAWELITTPRRSCSRPSNASDFSCYSAMFPTQGIQYSQICGRFHWVPGWITTSFYNWKFQLFTTYRWSIRWWSKSDLWNPRQHIWTFANELLESDGISVCMSMHK